MAVYLGSYLTEVLMENDTVINCISKELSLEKQTESMIINDISTTIQGYKETPSTPMIYR